MFILSRSFFVFICLIFLFPLDAYSQNAIKFDRKEGSSKLVIFVHGILGDGNSTWTHNRTNTNWPALMIEDNAFAGVDIATYQYPTKIFENNFSIDEIADHFRLRLQNQKIDKNYKDIAIIAHSMGGLVVRSLLLKHRGLIKPKMIYFLSTPTNGADLANYASIFTKNNQLNGLKALKDNQILQLQSSQLLASELKTSIRSYCAYETRDTKGVRIVSRQSATALCNQRLDPIPENHTRMAKPKNIAAEVYVAFKVAFGETFERLKLVRNAKDRYFDKNTLVLGNVIVADKLVD